MGRTRRLNITVTYLFSDRAAQRLALPAGGRDEIALFYRNPLQATQNASKRVDSHPSGARCVGRRSANEWTP
ncbi:MAG: hypothetical protein QM730_04015 [Anaerolineales bacterium]